MMRKRIITCAIALFLFSCGYAQTDILPAVTVDSASIDAVPLVMDPISNIILNENRKETVYTLHPEIDVPVVTVGTGWSVYAFTKIYSKGSISEEQILRLNKSDINGFDRWAVRPYSKAIDDFSYYPFYAAMPLPLIFFLTGKDTRSDFLKLTFLYWEAMSVTGFFGTGSTYLIDRYRPYTYSSETPMNQRTNQNAKNSFYAGHVQIIAVPTFFIAKVFADYHPDSKIKWVFYAAASVATGSMAYMRLQAGMHFPSDILLGTAMGALTGILVPEFHKDKSGKKHDMSILPYTNGAINGFVLLYKLK